MGVWLVVWGHDEPVWIGGDGYGNRTHRVVWLDSGRDGADGGCATVTWMCVICGVAGGWDGNRMVRASYPDALPISFLTVGVAVRNRQLYPNNWDDLASECKERAGWRCEHCGVAHGTPAVSERTGVVYTIYLAAAHVDHDPWNPQPRLMALCPSCHARYDYSWRERERWLALEEYRHRLLVDDYLYGDASGQGGNYGDTE